MKATEDHKPATGEHPERFLIMRCVNLNCHEWWPAREGTGWCPSCVIGTPMRPLKLIAEKDAS